MSDVEFYCCFSYLGPFWLIGLFSDMKNDRLLRFHINQGLLLFIAEMLLSAAAFFGGRALKTIPHVGGALCVLLKLAVIAYAFAMAFRGISDVINGRRRELPVIGVFRIIR